MTTNQTPSPQGTRYVFVHGVPVTVGRDFDPPVSGWVSTVIILDTEADSPILPTRAAALDWARQAIAEVLAPDTTGLAYCESHEPTGADRADGYAPAGSACWACGLTDADNIPIYVTEGD